ncbi:MAG: glycosyltransferase family 9 protein [Candidatus Latescibacterota bacterium]
MTAKTGDKNISGDGKLAAAVARLEAGGRILVTRLQYLGDAVLTLPLVDAIKERFPGAEVDYLCRPPASDLLKRDPRFANVFELDPEAGFAAGVQLALRLRARGYAAVIDLYSNPRSAWLARLSGAGVRIGSDRRGRRRLYTHPVSVPGDVRSAIAHHLAHGELLGVATEERRPVLTLDPDEVELARGLLDAVGVETRRPDSPRIGIHPGGKWEVKRWPVSSFAGLVSLLRDQWDGKVVVFTGPGEEEITEQLRQAVGDGAVFIPALPVRAVAAVMSLLDGVVVSDGGIMHISVAVGTPTVGIFGSAEPDIWFPYEPFGPFAPAVVPMECRPCHKHVCPLGHTDCLNRITPDMVAETLREIMSGRRPVRAPEETSG